MYLAPVLVSVYDKKENLNKCINSLRENYIAKNTIPHVVSDNYKEEIKRINDLVSKYQVNKNCERILEFLGITLEK